ncbi:N-acetyltransferase family protein [Streptococcus ictaluri]|uniref:FR47-like protein n=1 Tax=Streptococcus ictaluri 707-05 TaxID=764299 RepID=G5K649_9STRE|nr:GNAT family N-acetyltransferase [Streptococcus ictaluri]EHI68686.1 FR47-like protein [Streptococcus ictaluri 707-05]
MIREMKAEDAFAIREICDKSLGYNISVDLVEQQIQKIAQDNTHHYVLVFENEHSNEILGFVHAEIYDTLYAYSGLNILGLVVLPEHERRGIAKTLMTSLEDRATKKGLAFIRLNSAVKRKGAHSFYETIGYVCDKEQNRFIKTISVSQ